MYLSISLSVCLSVCLSIHPYVFYLSVYISACLSVCLSVCLSIYPSIRLSALLSMCLSIYICLCVCLSTHLSIPIHPSVCLLSICLSVYLSSALCCWASFSLIFRLALLSLSFPNVVSPALSVWRVCLWPRLIAFMAGGGGGGRHVWCPVALPLLLLVFCVALVPASRFPESGTGTLLINRFNPTPFTAGRKGCWVSVVCGVCGRLVWPLLSISPTMQIILR